MAIDNDGGGDAQSSKSQVEKLIAELTKFEAWFQYAETAGQSRLYNFLMAASILFLACAALIAVEKSTAYLGATLLSGFGVFLSERWIVYGERQIVFHEMFQFYITEHLNKIGRLSPDRLKSLPIYYISDIKHPDALEIRSGTPFALTDRQREISTRTTLRRVPSYFMYAFLASTVISGLKFMAITCWFLDNCKS